ncbi:hypothetical protein Q5W88_04035 [Shouchella clausii]|uniref:hypothetical protein n=1 Tax=Shouchella clausii TaxID=79880 RepID=UPI0026F42CD8|nr:hypothetical protein [Shouchella clausii]MDO7282300.1 hypothetical protein [Shouchella clausii]MDO7302395.1 hypothetical protein [Shouchella clausii]
MEEANEKKAELEARLASCEKTIAHLVDENAKANAKIDALFGVIRSISSMTDRHFVKDATAILEANGDLYRADAYGLSLEEYRKQFGK